MKDYVEKAILTENHNTEEIRLKIDHKTIRSIHAAMGILTEAAELSDVADHQGSIDEIGDLLWYTALLCDSRDFDFNALLKEADEETVEYVPFSAANFLIPYGLLREGSSILDLFKKRMFYYKPINEEVLLKLTKRIFKHIVSYCKEHKIDVKEAMEKNIQKLATRYPDKFKSSDAINRDISKEKEIFKG